MPALKRAAIERLYAAWLAHPELRLGQLIASATHRATGSFDPFNIEDNQLVVEAEWLP